MDEAIKIADKICILKDGELFPVSRKRQTSFFIQKPHFL
jgi:ABC-type proline/glycine betaine transport system ATPase subunit